ncbi:MAG: metal-binding protein [Novosphingobium sp. 16-62-11]|nr:MAG: metal-binding protein [Novosphingobium sp. 16-62-11]
MLRPVEPEAAVVVCSTCRHSAEQREDESGRRGGAVLAEAMRMVQQADPSLQNVEVQEMACLFACQRHCTVHVRAPGKISYILGGFQPAEEDARAILEYAALHAVSAEGVVPYGQWPQGVKGHFITRTPPEGFVCT